MRIWPEIARRARGRLGRALGRTAAATRPVIPAAVLELARSGPVPLAPRPPASSGPLTLAIVIPSFRRGSGGHATIVNLAKALRARGHHVTLWLEDYELRHAGGPASETRRSFAEFFAAAEFPLETSYAAWQGADVVLATGWQTVPRVQLLPGATARAYLVQDHEPEFYGASAQALLAADTYRAGLHCIAASPWLATLLRERYGARSSSFDLAVDHDIYRPAAGTAGAPGGGRRGDAPRDPLLVFYARWATERRAVPLGMLALEQLAARRPDVRIALFGSDQAPYAPFAHANLGVLEPAALAELYRRATVGMVFSLTNPSLTGLEMMACGLPCVELATEPIRATFGTDGPLRLAPPDPLAISSTIEALLDDAPARRRVAAAGPAFMAQRTWSRAAEQVEQGLRAALVARE